MTAFNTQVIRDLQRVVADLADVTANISAIGTTSGAKVVTDATGTLQQYLRGVVTLIAAQAAYLDGLETAIASTNTKLDTVIGHVDGLETLITASNTKLDTIATNTA